MKTVKNTDKWGVNYFIHINGFHHQSYNTLEAALGDLAHLAKESNTESITLETRDFWLKNADN